jgi:hypothetical protein
MRCCNRHTTTTENLAHLVATFAFLVRIQRCTPLSLVLDLQNQGQQEYGAFPPPNTVKSAPCPICRSGCVEGITILPLCFTELERATELRRNSVDDSTVGVAGATKKKNGKGRDSPEAYAEASYLLLNDKSSSLPSGISEREQQRTGRWTDEEIAFVDYLVSAFDQGRLPLPHGIKLNEFLGDMLICKSSRLTKKMKNAKLSTRSFELCNPRARPPYIDFGQLSGLQEKFLSSVSSETTQLELRFNLTKQWRTHFSNLCIQVGYPYLEARYWVSSLEEMERRASNAEEMIRKARRQRMGLALQTDGGSSASSNVFIGGVQADAVASQGMHVLSTDVPESSGPRRLSNSDDNGSDEVGEDEDDDMFSMLEAFDSNNDDANEPLAKRARTHTLSQDFISENRKDRSYSEDFDSVLRDLMVEPDSRVAAEKLKTIPQKKAPNHSCGPFLDAITMFMEMNNLPFQHAGKSDLGGGYVSIENIFCWYVLIISSPDVWVPSFLPRESNGPSKAVDTEQLRLFHAGYATRGDLEDNVAYSFHEYGVYSDNFSFEPGHGLPGRVYTSGEIAWDTAIDEANPKFFERAGGAKVYGVKTAVGIPLSTPLVGRIVVCMYSKHNVPENMAIAKECAAELMKYSPEPKWKLVIEMNNGPVKPVASAKAQDNKPEAGSYSSIQISTAKGQGPARGFTTQVVGCTNPGGANTSSMDQEEQRIVTLLGEHMPLSNGSTGESSSSAGSSGNLLQHFMSMRLLLLRPAARRMSRENEMIDVLKNSFRAYAKENRRSGAELASLLAKDWACLKLTFSELNGAPTIESQHLRRLSSTDMALSQAHAQLMQASYSSQSHPSPMSNPPSQFMPTPSLIGKVF